MTWSHMTCSHMLTCDMRMKGQVHWNSLSLGVPSPHYMMRTVNFRWGGCLCLALPDLSPGHGVPLSDL